jgi:hypothetical protein
MPTKQKKSSFTVAIKKKPVEPHNSNPLDKQTPRTLFIDDCTISKSINGTCLNVRTKKTQRQSLHTKKSTITSQTPQHFSRYLPKKIFLTAQTNHSSFNIVKKRKLTVEPRYCTPFFIYFFAYILLRYKLQAPYS